MWISCWFPIGSPVAEDKITVIDVKQEDQIVEGTIELDLDVEVFVMISYSFLSYYFSKLCNKCGTMFNIYT